MRLTAHTPADKAEQIRYTVSQNEINMKICVYHIITLAVLKKKTDDLTLPENAAKLFRVSWVAGCEKWYHNMTPCTDESIIHTYDTLPPYLH